MEYSLHTLSDYSKHALVGPFIMYLICGRCRGTITIYNSSVAMHKVSALLLCI